MYLRTFSRFPTTFAPHRYIHNVKEIGTTFIKPDFKVFTLQNLVKKAREYVNGPTAEDVTKGIDLTGKTCFITGANSGIGLEMLRVLMLRNCNVIVGCRNPYAAGVVARNTCEHTEGLRIYELNLASLSSVKKCSERVLKDCKKIDILILNAAVFGLPWTLTNDGLETIFQVNYLSQYYLLQNLENILAPDARVVFVSSESHRNIKWSIEKTICPTEEQLSLPKEEYTSIRAYNISKLCGILAMHYLNYRWVNTEKSVFCAHPGSFVKTQLCRNWWVYEALYATISPIKKTISQAASTPIYCVTSPDLNGYSDMYFKDLKHTPESELASNNHLAFRVNDLTRSIIRERVATADDLMTRETKTEVYEKTPIEETLISNYN